MHNKRQLKCHINKTWRITLRVETYGSLYIDSFELMADGRDTAKRKAMDTFWRLNNRSEIMCVSIIDIAAV